ncbi:MAG: trypsin-like peptidase domain-containing protein [Phycisphaerales bacterium]
MRMRRFLTGGLLVVLAAAPAAGHPDERPLRRTPVVEVFEAARDAVVNISSTEVVEVRDRFDRLFGRRRAQPRRLERTSVGSGFVIHPEGYIVTNAHVVARSTDRRVTFADGSEYDATVVASDREYDVAILKIDPPRPLPTLAFGRSDDLMIGETVIAIGNPFGYQHTVTAGVVSAVNRDLVFDKDLVMSGLIQIDASINPGNSGGPLLNVLGELIGVNTAIRDDAQNIGFAIPVDHLRRLLPELLDVERRYRIDSGLRLVAAVEPRVDSVKSGSAAEHAGIEPGDVLRMVNGETVDEAVDFHIALIGMQPGDELRLELVRGGRRYRTSLQLGDRPRPDAPSVLRQRLGVVVRPLPAKLAQNLGLPRGGGFVVVEIDPDSPAREIGMRSRDVLVALGRYYPTTLDELGELVDSLDAHQEVSVTFLRVKPPTIYRYRDRLIVR